MKTAVICPIGHLDRMGYQNVAEPCINSMAEFADRVYLVQSIRDKGWAARWAHECGRDNVHVIASRATWMARNVDGTQRFNALRVMENCNMGLNAAKKSKHDAALVLFCNNYIPVTSYEHLRGAMQRMLDVDEPLTWYVRMDQLGGNLFHSSVTVPFIVNLCTKPLMRIACDATTDEVGVWRMTRGDYSIYDYEAIVDVQLEMTLPDLAEKMNFIRCYSDLVSKRSPIFSWDLYWRKYFIEKFKKKSRSNAPLSPTGKRIKELSQPEFVSHEVLRGLG